MSRGPGLNMFTTFGKKMVNSNLWVRQYQKPRYFLYFHISTFKIAYHESSYFLIFTKKVIFINILVFRPQVWAKKFLL